jgi:hypothetical protein
VAERAPTKPKGLPKVAMERVPEEAADLCQKAIVKAVGFVEGIYCL